MPHDIDPERSKIIQFHKNLISKFHERCVQQSLGAVWFAIDFDSYPSLIPRSLLKKIVAIIFTQVTCLVYWHICADPKQADIRSWMDQPRGGVPDREILDEKQMLVLIPICAFETPPIHSLHNGKIRKFLLRDAHCELTSRRFLKKAHPSLKLYSQTPSYWQRLQASVVVISPIAFCYCGLESNLQSFRTWIQATDLKFNYS